MVETTTTIKFPNQASSNESPISAYQGSFYRPDIQGIRAISALLIMIYHIWLARVSGGVDVFFVISGFLMTTVILRGAAKSGKVSAIGFWKRIVLRVFPSAYLVLTATIFLSLLFVPLPLLKYGLNEFVASAAHIENLELIRMGSNYLDREAPPSQFQQFWALSIQMQFYLILPFAIGALVLAARKLRDWRLIPAGILIGIFASFIYSVTVTASNPNAAYFNPGARAWEFLAGALIASLYPFLGAKGPRLAIVNAISAVLALATLVTFGLWSGSSPQFPGWIALIPVTAALVLILVGRDPTRANWVTSTLSNRTLVYLGGFSFTIYLWHWPLLVFAQHQFGTTTLTLWQGMAVILVAIILAALTKKFVEDKTRVAPDNPNGTRRVIVYLLVAVIVVGGGLAGRQVLIEESSTYRAQLAQPPLDDEILAEPQVDQISTQRFATVDYDRPRGIGCLGGKRCILGDKEAERTVALVGDSHTAQWVDAVDFLGRELGYRVETHLNQSELSYVVENIKPDAVITVSTRTSSIEEVSEVSRVDQIETWESFSDADIPVIGIRDNPRFGYFQNACVWQNRDNVAECALPRDTVLIEKNPTEALQDQIENFYPVDLTHFFCTDVSCPAVSGDSFIYYDKHHMTRTYVNTVSDAFVSELLKQAPGVLTKQPN